MSGDYASRVFPETAWTVLDAAKNLPDGQRVQALNEFIGRYWKPVFYFIRGKGHALHQAEDWTQDFLIRVMEKDLIADADRGRGRFRNYLLANLQWFLADQGHARTTAQRKFESGFVSVSTHLNDEDRTFEPALNEEPKNLFMKKWARHLIDLAHQRAREWCKDEGRPDWWYEAFTAVNRIEPSSQEGLAQKYGQTRDQVRYALNMVKDYFRQSLRKEVRYQVDSDENVDDEIRELLALL